MSKEKEKEESLIKDKIEMINAGLGIFVSILTIASSSYIEDVLNSELLTNIFRIILFILLIYVFLLVISIIRAFNKSIKNYLYSTGRIYKYSAEDELRKHLLYYEIKNLRKKTVRRLLRYIVPRFFLITITIILIIVICLIYPLSAKSLWENMHGTVKIFEISEDMPELMTEEQKTGIKPTTISDDLSKLIVDEKERKPSGYKFILTNPDKIFVLNSYIESQVFFYNDGTISLSDLVTIYLSNLKENKRAGVNIEDIMKEGIMYDEEYKFRSEAAKYMDIEYLDDWYAVAPSSDELDTYIQKRMELSNVTIDGNQGCYELWWRLANDYKYYALEYEIQTDNESAVLYYYSMSIYCCMKALEYEMNDDMHDLIYRYMVMSYHDMCRDDCIILDFYKEIAKVIYSVVVSDAI